MSSFRAAARLALALFLSCSGALAQTVTAPPAGQTAGGTQTAPASPPFTAGWQDGFVVQSANGDYRLQFGLVAQFDGRFALDDPAPIIDTFTIRKARPSVSGRLGRYFDFKVVPDFGSGVAVLMDANFDIRFSPKFRVRTGKDKSPVGYEVLVGDPYLLFPERSLASSLLPNRDVGVQVQGDLAGGKLYYAGGVFNGVNDGASSVVDVDLNAGKDLAGRIVLQPFRVAAGQPASALSGLGFNLGGTVGNQVGALPAYRTSVGQIYYAYAAAVSADGDRTRGTAAAFYYYKAFGAFAEYARSTQDVARDAIRTEVGNTGWNVTGSYVLTGEAGADRGVRPTDNFDPATGQWGALQLVARYSALDVDDVVFSANLAAANASGGARAVTIGANWYPNAYIKYYATFEHTTFEGSRADENAILVRAQVAF